MPSLPRITLLSLLHEIADLSSNPSALPSVAATEAVAAAEAVAVAAAAVAAAAATWADADRSPSNRVKI